MNTGTPVRTVSQHIDEWRSGSVGTQIDSPFNHGRNNRELPAGGGLRQPLSGNTLLKGRWVCSRNICTCNDDPDRCMSEVVWRDIDSDFHRAFNSGLPVVNHMTIFNSFDPLALLQNHFGPHHTSNR